MKQIVLTFALLFGVLIAIPGTVTAGDPYQWEGYVQQVDARRNIIVVGGQRYAVAKKVKIYGLGANPTLADLQPRTEIGYKVTYNPQSKRNDLIVEIWLREM